MKEEIEKLLDKMIYSTNNKLKNISFRLDQPTARSLLKQLLTELKDKHQIGYEQIVERLNNVSDDELANICTKMLVHRSIVKKLMPFMDTLGKNIGHVKGYGVSFDELIALDNYKIIDLITKTQEQLFDKFHDKVNGKTFIKIDNFLFRHYRTHIYTNREKAYFDERGFSDLSVLFLATKQDLKNAGFEQGKIEELASYRFLLPENITSLEA